MVLLFDCLFMLVWWWFGVYACCSGLLFSGLCNSDVLLVLIWYCVVANCWADAGLFGCCLFAVVRRCLDLLALFGLLALM